MKTFLKAFLVGLGLFASGIAYGQSFGKEFSTAYEFALLDSLIRYEKLKSSHSSLQKAYEYREKENTDLRNALRVSELLTQLQKEQDSKTIAGLERKIRRMIFWQKVKDVTLTVIVVAGTTYYLITVKP